MKRFRLPILCILLLTVIPSASAASQPKLVVGIVIDQFRYDYLERFSDLFEKNGFRRLMNEGAVFTDAQYLHSQTVTSVGHATFMSGSIPALNGVIANEWFDRLEGKTIASVWDKTVKPVGAEGNESSSPWRLMGSTLGDELKLATGGASHVIGVSMKDRSAIFPSGHHPDGAFWFDAKSGRFVTSTYYMEKLPTWTQDFNSRHLADGFLGKTWQKLRPESDYKRSNPDDSPYERPEHGKVFPHPVGSYADILETPFSNDLLEAFAEATIDGGDLGKHDATDLFTISFSANDTIGHAFGPYSQEVEDVTLRTDIVLGKFFQYLDNRLGKDNYIVVLTADHGVAPSPEQAVALGLGGGRYADSEVADYVGGSLKQRFGDENWVLADANDNLYLNREAASRRKVNLDQLARVAAEASLQLPAIARAYTTEDFRNNAIPLDPLSQRIARNYFADRSGDVVLIPKPYYVSGANTTGHGTPYSYDTNVPVIFWGAWFEAGRYGVPASPADIAPTLANVLHITRPSEAVGLVHSEAIRRVPGGSSN